MCNEDRPSRCSASQSSPTTPRSTTRAPRRFFTPMRSSSTSETPISADAALVIDRLQWTVYCWIGLGWVEIIDLFERRFKWPKKPPYSCCDKGHRSDWRGRDCPQRGAAGLAAAAQLRKGVHPKVQLPPCRGGKVVTTSSFALPTNPTEQFNNFKKYLPAYLVWSSTCLGSTTSPPPTSANTTTR